MITLTMSMVRMHCWKLDMSGRSVSAEKGSAARANLHCGCQWKGCGGGLPFSGRVDMDISISDVGGALMLIMRLTWSLASGVALRRHGIWIGYFQQLQRTMQGAL